MASPSDSAFLSHVSVLCRDILVFCRDLFGSVYKGCTEEEFQKDIVTCATACDNLREFVTGYETPNTEKKFMLLHHIGLLIVKLKELIPDLRILQLNPNDNDAKQSLQSLRQEFVDVAKNVLMLAKQVEAPPVDAHASPGRVTPYSHPALVVTLTDDNSTPAGTPTTGGSTQFSDREAAKRNCIGLLKHLTNAIVQQDREEWKEVARHLAQVIQNTVRNFPTENSQLILRSVLDLVSVSKDCFKADSSEEAMSKFNERRIKVEEYLQFIGESPGNVNESRQGNSTEDAEGNNGRSDESDEMGDGTQSGSEPDAGGSPRGEDMYRILKDKAKKGRLSKQEMKELGKLRKDKGGDDSEVSTDDESIDKPKDKLAVRPTRAATVQGSMPGTNGIGAGVGGSSAGSNTSVTRTASLGELPEGNEDDERPVPPAGVDLTKQPARVQDLLSKKALVNDVVKLVQGLLPNEYAALSSDGQEQFQKDLLKAAQPTGNKKQLPQPPVKTSTSSGQLHTRNPSNTSALNILPSTINLAPTNTNTTNTGPVTPEAKRKLKTKEKTLTGGSTSAATTTSTTTTSTTTTASSSTTITTTTTTTTTTTSSSATSNMSQSSSVNPLSTPLAAVAKKKVEPKKALFFKAAKAKKDDTLTPPPNLSMDRNTPRSELARHANVTVLRLLNNIHEFLVASKFIAIPTEAKPLQADTLKAGLSVKTEKKNVILATIKSLLDIVRDTYKLVPPLSEFSEESAMYRVSSRVNALIEAEISPHELPIDEDLFAEGFNLLLLKKNMLMSIEFRTNRLQYATSQFLSMLCALRRDASDYFYILCLLHSLAQSLQNILDDVETYLCLLRKELNLVEKEKETKKKKEKKDKKKDDMYKEAKNMPEDKDDRYHAGTLNNLIIRLTTGTMDRDFLTAFLNGYPTFARPQELWEKFVERYNAMGSGMETHEIGFMRVRVSRVLVEWVKQDFHMLDPELVSQIHKFCEKTLQKDVKDSATILLKELHDENRFCLDNIEKVPPEIVAWNSNEPLFETVLKYNNQLIAEQLTLIELEIFKRINPSELVGMRWAKPKLRVLSQNVLFLIDRVTRLSFWVATVILLQPKLKDRQLAIKKFVNIAQKLFTQNNFNSLIGVLNGLSMSVVSRLKLTWEGLPKKTTEKYAQLCVLEDPTNGFKNLREVIKNSGKIIPYLGIYLQDLNMMEEMPTLVPRGEDNEYINFPKYHLISSGIKNLLIYQKSLASEVPTRIDPLYTYLYELPGMTDKELYALSQEREAKVLRDVQ